MSQYTATFFPDDLAVQVASGTTIFEAAARAGIELKSTCGNEGTCGRCAVKVKQGKVNVSDGNIPKKLRRTGHVLACQTTIEGNVVVEIPKDSRLDEHQVLVEDKNTNVLKAKEIDVLEGYELNPICRKVKIELTPPSRTENASDLSRLQTELKKEIGNRNLHISLNNLRSLAAVLREGEWKVTVTLAFLNGTAEIIHLEPGFSERQSYGLAVDIGTTTVVVYLIDLDTGAIVDKAGTYNKQARYGDDVISRIIYANQKDGLKFLHEAVVKTINSLIDKLLQINDIQKNDVHVCVNAGNTTMTQLLLGLDPKYIRLEPYIPTATEFPPVKASELGLNINHDAWVLSFPAVASYVGGDIVSGVLATRQANAEETILFIDIGTNGEMVLGNKDWLMCCSCSAGPAFEGGGITFGMRAMNGAIERVQIDPESYEVEVKAIGGYKPIGICGSGLIDCIAKLHRVKLIDRTGRFENVKTPRLRRTEDDVEFVLAWGEETECGKDIVITENDIKNLIRSKGAVYAGIQSMLKSMELPLEVVDKILIAGGFGNYLNVPDAIELGLLPDLPVEKFEFVGNTSVKGAQLALLSQEAFKEALRIGHSMTYLDLSSGNLFMDEFMSALFLPHTDLTQFPSVQ